MLLAVLILLFTVPALAQGQDDGLEWSLGLVRMDGGQVSSVPFSRPVDFRVGDRFEILIHTDEPSSVLILAEEGEGEVSVIRQGTLAPGMYHPIPGGTEWFRLDPPSGTLQFHILVGRVLPASLLEMAGELKRPEIRSRLLDALAQIRKEVSLMAESPIRPGPIAGVVKGSGELVFSGFRGRDLYVKTIRIDY